MNYPRAVRVDVDGIVEEVSWCLLHDSLRGLEIQLEKLFSSNKLTALQYKQAYDIVYNFYRYGSGKQL